MAWLLATREGEVEIYFVGRKGQRGGLRVTLWRHEAFHFETPAEAYAAANTHPEMKNSEDWKVVPR